MRIEKFCTAFSPPKLMPMPSMSSRGWLLGCNILPHPTPAEKLPQLVQSKKSLRAENHHQDQHERKERHAEGDQTGSADLVFGETEHQRIQSGDEDRCQHRSADGSE